MKARRLVQCVAMTLLSACVTAPRSAAEHYTLQDIGGARVPAQVGPYPYWSGSIELRPDSTFSDVIVLGVGKPQLVDSMVGRYRVDVDSIRMAPKSWAPYAVWRDAKHATLRVRWEAVYTYRRDK